MKDMKQTFVEKLHECNQHKKRLLSAKRNLQSLIPLSVDSYNNLSEENISFIDQMLFRFSKLQDTMGEKVFPTILDLNAENVKKMTFIDRLNRLEELELLDKNEWMQLRKERNEIAHEYSFNQEEVVGSINIIFSRIDNLIQIYTVIYNYCVSTFKFVKTSSILK